MGSGTDARSAKMIAVRVSSTFVGSPVMATSWPEVLGIAALITKAPLRGFGIGASWGLR